MMDSEEATERTMLRDGMIVSVIAFAYLTLSTLSAGVMAMFNPGVKQTFMPDVATALFVLPRATFYLMELDVTGAVDAVFTIPASVGGFVGATLLVILFGGHGYIMFRLSRGYYNP